MADQSDYKALMEPLARYFFGEPNRQMSTAVELRFGSHGSMAIRLDSGTFFDHERGEGGGVLDLVSRETGAEGQDRFKWLEDHGFHLNGGGTERERRQVAAYDYRDDRGALLFQVVRFDPKQFLQRRPAPGGGWEWSTKGVKQVPYRLPELLVSIKDKRLIWVVEGEKDADRLISLGAAATTNAGGVGKWRSELDAHFTGADVVIVADNDPQAKDKPSGEPLFHADGRPRFPGFDHAHEVAAKLAAVAGRVRVLDLGKHWQDCPPKGDASDFFDCGGTIEKLGGLLGNVLDWTPAQAQSRLESVAPSGKPAGKKKSLIPPDAPLWVAGLRMTKQGVPVPDMRNCLYALRAEPMLDRALTFDEMQQQPILVRALPLAPGARPSPPPPRQLTDDDVSGVQEWLQWAGLARLGRDVVGQGLHKRAREFRFHPIRDWLDDLKWDGEPRLNDWLMTYLGAAGEPEYLRGVGRMFLISMVARICHPGCKCDYMLILEGPQGVEKSKACAVLAGEWFSDALRDIHSKDASQHLRGKWLIEISDFAAFKRADIEGLKAYLSRTTEQYRAPYGKEEVYEPRQCVFIGSINPKGGFLKDETGARRFWPVRVGQIDCLALKRDRNQLFAEAVERFREGDLWWPDAAFERQYIAPEQEERFDADIWETPVAEFLLHKHTTTVLEVATGVLGYAKADPFSSTPTGTPINRLSAADSKRITDVLAHLGWSPRKSGNRRWWVPPAAEAAAHQSATQAEEPPDDDQPF